MEALIDDLLEFVFPPHQSHPRTAARLYAFALYGPTDRDSSNNLRLRGGVRDKKSGAVNYLADHELKILLQQIERELIVEAYCRTSIISPEEEQEILQRADKQLVTNGAILQYTRQEILNLIAANEANRRPKEKDFTFIQRCILKDRDHRIAELRKSVPNVEAVRHDKTITRSKQLNAYNRTTASAYNLENLSDYATVSHLLHRESHNVFHLGEGRMGGSHTLNTMLLRRELEGNSAANKEEGWHNYCCLKGSRSKPSYVQSRNTTQAKLHGI